MEIVSNFGIEPVFLAAQIVNFLIIAYLLKRFAYKPIMSLLKNRQDTIAKGLLEAEEARVLLEQASEKEQEILKAAQMEAKKMLDETKKHNEALMHSAEEQTRKQAEEMLKEAKEQIIKESQETEKRLVKHTSELAVTFLEKAVKDLFGPEEQKEVMKRAMKEMKGKEN